MEQPLERLNMSSCEVVKPGSMKPSANPLQGLVVADSPNNNTYHLGMVNTRHKNGDDLGMVYYWVHHIICDDIKLYTYHILVGE